MPLQRESRSRPRLRRRLKVAVEHATAFTLDVSAGGFCAEMMRVLAPGSPVLGTIRVGDHEFPFSGQVAWAKSGDARINLRGKMGVRFTQVSPQFSQLLETR